MIILSFLKFFGSVSRASPKTLLKMAIFSQLEAYNRDKTHNPIICKFEKKAYFISAVKPRHYKIREICKHFQ
jgi:hypothetical protein